MNRTICILPTTTTHRSELSHAGIAEAWDKAISRVCESLSVCVSAIHRKSFELSTPKLVHYRYWTTISHVKNEIKESLNELDNYSYQSIESFLFIISKDEGLRTICLSTQGAYTHLLLFASVQLTRYQAAKQYAPANGSFTEAYWWCSRMINALKAATSTKTSWV